MSEFVKQSTNINSGFDKVDWLVDYPSSFTSKVELSFRFLQIEHISSLLEKLSYLEKIVLNENSKFELKWRVQNLELCNGRALTQSPAEVLI